MHASCALLCTLLLVACSRPALVPSELDDVVDLPVMDDTLQSTAVTDWRSLGPVPIDQPERRFRAYAEMSRKEQHSLDSTAGALRERGVVMCY